MLGPRSRAHVLVAIALLLALSAFTQDVARAHGGTYRGPSDPNIQPTPSSGPGLGDTAGAPTGAGSPRADGGAAQGGGGGPRGGPSSPGASRGTPTSVAPVKDLGWSRWWELNKDPFLALKSRLYVLDVRPGTELFFLGRLQPWMTRDNLRPSARQVEGEIVPALLDLLSTETHNEIVTGALIALARTGRAGDSALAGNLQAAFLPFLADANQEIAETAALALGILAHDGGVPVLRELLFDTPDARRDLVRRNEVHYRTRAFAAYGLSLIGNVTRSAAAREEIVDLLFRALYADKTATVDVAAACMIAIGRVPIAEAFPDASSSARALPRERWPASSCLIAQIDALLAYFADRSKPFLVRAHAPGAIAALLEGLPGSVASPLKQLASESLLERLGRGTPEPQEIVQGCILALGTLGDNDGDANDVAIRKSLLAAQETASDGLVRGLASISLARIAARAGTGTHAGSGRAAIETSLLRRLEGGTTERPWAALALGVLGRADLDARSGASPNLARALVAALERARVPDELAAYAIAAGMAGVEDALPLLHEKLELLAVDEARGYVVLGMGLLGRRDATEAVQSVVHESRYRPNLLRQAAISLGLLGDKGAVPDLLEMMAASRSLSSQAATASALGIIGDSRSIAPLLAVLRDRDGYTDAARGFAAVSLGLVADDSLLPWNTQFAVGLNFAAAPATLDDADGAGILNIL